jgi:hypothetical protein
MARRSVGTNADGLHAGRRNGAAPVRPAEIELADATRDRFARSLRSLYNDEQMTALMTASIPAAGLAVEVGVDEVFIQTPGPGAGARVAP